MTDRELLGLAAKAAEFKFFGFDAKGNLCIDPVDYTPWNPLKDDGDALRLAVKLGISIEVHHDESQPKPWLRIVYADCRWEHAMVDEYEKDPYAATRRAIVRAAAEIGKGME